VKRGPVGGARGDPVGAEGAPVVENSFYVSVRSDSADEITTHWKNLADNATVIHDLAPAGWSPLYGMLKDQFGVVWVLDVAVNHSAP